MNLFWITLYQWRYQDFLALVQKPTHKTLVFTPNPEILVRAHRDEDFMHILRQATYSVPDGNGLFVGYMMNEWVSFIRAALTVFFYKKWVREQYGELIKGSDLTRDILKSWKSEEYVRILILDKKIIDPRNDFEIKKQVIQKDMKSLLEANYPWVDISVFFDWEDAPDALARYIQDHDIAYVFSCLGMKTQELRLIEIFEHLSESSKVVWLGVGASIDFLIGLQKRAPVVFQKLGLEWLYRLISQPRIRAKRIYDAVVEFPRLLKKY